MNVEHVLEVGDIIVAALCLLMFAFTGISENLGFSINGLQQWTKHLLLLLVLSFSPFLYHWELYSWKYLYSDCEFKSDIARWFFWKNIKQQNRISWLYRIWAPVLDQNNVNPFSSVHLSFLSPKCASFSAHRSGRGCLVHTLESDFMVQNLET